MDKIQLAARVDAALANDRVLDASELDSILADASVGGISADEIISARALLKDAGADLAATQAAYDQAGRNLDYAKQRWSIIDGVKAGGDRVKTEMALTEARGRYDAYAKIANAFYLHASPTARTAADVNSGFEKHVAPVGHAIRDFFEQF